MKSDSDVVVTGLGLVTPLGTDLETVWAGLVAGKNGITRAEVIDPALLLLGAKVVGHVVKFDLDRFQIKKKHIRNMNFLTKMLLYAGLSALDNAGIRYPDDTVGLNVGAIIGTGTALGEHYHNVPYEDRPPEWFLDTYPNIPLSYLARTASLTGYGCTIVSACVSSTQAIGQAYKMIQSGQAQVLIAGGVENKLSAPYISGFSRLHMSTNDDDPETAMRPFDKTRNGFVIANGAAVLVLESLGHARRRGAEPQGRIVGYGSTLSALSLTDADSRSKERAMAMALLDAGLRANEIGYINAHGTGTISNDREETIALKNFFGKHAYNIPVNSTKSMMGHSFGASGAIEASVCIKSLHEQKVHPTRNFNQGDDVCNLNYVKDVVQEAPMKYCMSNSSGMGGYNSTLILGKVD